MKFYLDQSIKIENTQKASYICISNHQVVSCKISARDKRELKLFFRKLNKPLIFKLFTFSVMCAHIIIKSQAKNITIDDEYTNHRRNIKSFIIQVLSIYNHPLLSENINFQSIGKNNQAHVQAYQAYKLNRTNLTINAQQIIILYEKVNKK